MLFAETPKVLRQALAYGGSARYLEYFQWVVRASGFKPFTEYSKVNRAKMVRRDVSAILDRGAGAPERADGRVVQSPGGWRSPSISTRTPPTTSCPP